MKHNLFITTEGRLLLSGIALSLLLIFFIIFYAVTDLHTAEILVLVFVAHTFGGRAAGIGLCILNGFGAFPTILYNFYIEVLIVCFTYAGFVYSTTNYLKVEWLIKFKLSNLRYHYWLKKSTVKEIKNKIISFNIPLHDCKIGFHAVFTNF